MSSQQRSEVWRGIRSKTSGGLTKDMLTKNKRGKIVSKKKSGQASDQNNLGSWLRQKGKKIAKKDMLQKKSAPPEDAPKSKMKKTAPKPKYNYTPLFPKKKTKKVVKINPITQQAYEKKSKAGYVEGGQVSLDNLKLKKLRPKKKAKVYDMGTW